MVQMIPPTYEAMRRIYPSVGLNPDFVEGMRDQREPRSKRCPLHAGHLDGLLESEQVRKALEEKTATQAELLAAGYTRIRCVCRATSNAAATNGGRSSRKRRRCTYASSLARGPRGFQEPRFVLREFQGGTEGIVPQGTKTIARGKANASERRPRSRRQKESDPEGVAPHVEGATPSGSDSFTAVPGRRSVRSLALAPRLAPGYCLEPFLATCGVRLKLLHVSEAVPTLPG